MLTVQSSPALVVHCVLTVQSSPALVVHCVLTVQSSPVLVVHCVLTVQILPVPLHPFVTLQKEEFQMYSIYCQNKPKSEALRMRVGDSNPFFKECQRKLGHKLPLGAYLLKPVQRITKYQLLLKVIRALQILGVGITNYQLLLKVIRALQILGVGITKYQLLLNVKHPRLC